MFNPLPYLNFPHLSELDHIGGGMPHRGPAHCHREAGLGRSLAKQPRGLASLGCTSLCVVVE